LTLVLSEGPFPNPADIAGELMFFRITVRCKNGIALVLGLILAIALSGCGRSTRDAGDTEVVFAPTEVGTPQGDKATKAIGPAGGTLGSLDGRMTLTVPNGALTETIPFSIQPITNKAANGIGLAYRLEPNGQTFTTPLQISVRYDEKDLEGTVPEALSIAYQDSQGAWHELKAVDQTENTLTVAATHFTDWSFLAKMRIEPAKAKVVVGKTVVLVLLGCMQKDPTFADRFRKAVFGDKWNDGRPMVPEYCNFGTVASVPFGWYVDIGTIESGTNPVVYQAPPQKPNPNIATVAFPYLVADGQDCFTGDCMRRAETRKGVLTSRITIVERGYTASGQDGPVVYSGKICDLERPFSITGTHPIFTFPFEFVPSSPTAGTASYQTSKSGISARGNGPYTIVGLDTDTPRILWQSQSTATIPVITTSGGGTATINLTPLRDGEECD
jgi:hypothetical protein